MTCFLWCNVWWLLKYHAFLNFALYYAAKTPEILKFCTLLCNIYFVKDILTCVLWCNVLMNAKTPEIPKFCTLLCNIVFKETCVFWCNVWRLLKHHIFLNFALCFSKRHSDLCLTMQCLVAVKTPHIPKFCTLLCNIFFKETFWLLSYDAMFDGCSNTKHS